MRFSATASRTRVMPLELARPARPTLYLAASEYAVSVWEGSIHPSGAGEL